MFFPSHLLASDCWHIQRLSAFPPRALATAGCVGAAAFIHVSQFATVHKGALSQKQGKANVNVVQKGDEWKFRKTHTPRCASLRGRRTDGKGRGRHVKQSDLFGLFTRLSSKTNARGGRFSCERCVKVSSDARACFRVHQATEAFGLGGLVSEKAKPAAGTAGL